jgi:hypothetical protein
MTQLESDLAATLATVVILIAFAIFLRRNP